VQKSESGYVHESQVSEGYAGTRVAFSGALQLTLGTETTGESFSAMAQNMTVSPHLSFSLHLFATDLQGRGRSTYRPLVPRNCEIVDSGGMARADQETLIWMLNSHFS
jgi:hypothetical protein